MFIFLEKGGSALEVIDLRGGAKLWAVFLWCIGMQMRTTRRRSAPLSIPGAHRNHFFCLIHTGSSNLVHAFRRAAHAASGRGRPLHAL